MKVLAVTVVGAVISAVVLPLVGLLAVVGLGWGVATTPAVGGAVAGIPPAALEAYVDAAPACPGLSWTVLAGIGKVESDHGQSTLAGVQSGANGFGAEGPMQFLPATFAAYAVASPGERAPSPYDLRDAALAAARMLCADGGGDPATLRSALWQYNHSWAYVDAVLGWAATYGAVTSGAVGLGDLGASAARWAVQQVGLPYEWGAAGPDAFDCSGLTMRAYESVGIGLPRVAAAQYGVGAHVPYAEAEVGDLVFYAADVGDPATIHHVAMLLGDGMMVEAPREGVPVRVVPVYAAGRMADVSRPWVR